MKLSACISFLLLAFAPLGFAQESGLAAVISQLPPCAVRQVLMVMVIGFFY